jgi:two-component system sensor histidine kinase AtoS
MNPQGSESGKTRQSLGGFLRRLRLVWKVNGAFLLILVVVLGLSGFLWNFDYERSAVASARETSRLTSERILRRVSGLMLDHEQGTLRAVVNRMASENPAFRDIRLISHSGQVVASQLESASTALHEEEWPCSVCHLEPLQIPDSTTTCCDEVLQASDAERVVSVVTPVMREEGCTSAECHADAVDSAVLGVIQADYSLAGVDTLIARTTRRTLLAMLLALVLGTAASWFMTDRIVGRRIRVLREGVRRIAAKDYSFRFQPRSSDGIAEVKSVLDSMTSELFSTITELSTAREHLQVLVNNSADMIITVDPTGLIATFNPGAEKILGYRAEEVVGTRIERLFADPADRAAALEELEHTDHVVNYVTRFRTKDGDARNVMVTLSRLRSENGSPIGTMGISKDITKELELQRQLLRSKRMAALGQALTGIQHTMKNMLNVMKGGSYMVNLGLKKDDLEILVEGWVMVQQGIRDMTQMSTSMLDFARSRRLKIAPTDLAELMTKAHTMSQAKYQEAGVILDLRINGELPPVECDGEMIRSVVMDLLANALDACSWKEYGPGEVPRVILGGKVGEGQDQVDILVADNGEGMPDEVKERIFTPFFSTKEKTGTGMGLAVVDRIVSSHEGTTTVESEPGKGATFRVSLPIQGPSLREEAG